MGQTVCFRCRQSLDEKGTLRLLTRTRPSCFSTLLSARDNTLSDYLESLEIPAALLSQDHTVLLSNRHFQRIAGSQGPVGLRAGEALDCMYAPMLGRCGETVACMLCWLKRSVEHTSLTGEGLRGIPMSFPHRSEKRRAFEITTEKIGDAVLHVMTAS